MVGKAFAAIIVALVALTIVVIGSVIMEYIDNTTGFFVLLIGFTIGFMDVLFAVEE